MTTRMLLLAALMPALAAVSCMPAVAQPTHTWVSAAGSDLNPGTFALPYRTLQFAVDSTASGGLVSVVGGGGLGPVEISRPITIDGNGSNASIVSTGGDPVVVGAQVQVILRRLTLLGGGASAGIQSIGNVVVDDCTISGVGDGIDSTGGSVDVRNTTIDAGTTGVSLILPGSGIMASVENCRITAGFAGILSASPGHLAVKNTIIHGPGIGIYLSQAGLNTGAGTATIQKVTIFDTRIAVNAELKSVVDIVDSTLTDNTEFGLFANNQSTINAKDDVIARNDTGVASIIAGTVRLVNVGLYDNGTGLATTVAGSSPGTVLTAHDNHQDGNTTDGATNGSVTLF